MKKIIFLIFVSLFTVLSLFSQDITEEKMKVVVLPGIDASSNGKMTGMLNITIEQMMRLGRFEVIDRRTTEQKMEELKLKLSGITDEEAVIELGLVLSSDIGMVVDVLSFNTSETEKKVEYETEDSVSVTYETEYTSVIDITIRQFEINTSRSMKTISVTGEGSADSYAASEEEAFRQLRGSLFSILKEFYPLILKVTEVRGNIIIVSGGENIGVKKGMKFDVLPSRNYLSRTGLVCIEKTAPNAASARILKGFAAVKAGYILEERINKFPETGISAGVSINFEDEITSLYFAFEFNTYNPFSGGLDFLFSVSDPEADFFRTNIFGVYKPLLGDTFDFGVRGGCGITWLYGVRDDDNNNISSLEFQLSAGAVTTFYLNEKLSFFSAGDYYFYPAEIMEWSYFTGEGEDRTRHDAAGNTPDLDPDGFYLTAGIKIIL